MRRLSVGGALSLLLCGVAGALPSTFNDERDGWMQFAVTVELSIPGAGAPARAFGFGVRAGGRGDFGFGLSLAARHYASEAAPRYDFTLDVLYFWSPFASDLLTVPFVLRAGAIDTALGVSLASGLQAFFVEMDAPKDTPENEKSYFTAASLLGGRYVNGLLRPFAELDLGFAFGFSSLDSGWGWSSQ